ncbi:MAG: hypothetical protein ACLQVJ_04120 [Syntrophobacteraceae bacterium]
MNRPDNAEQAPPAVQPPARLAGELGVILFGLLAVLGVVFAPPLFDFDGNTYWLYVQAPFDNLNEVHS